MKNYEKVPTSSKILSKIRCFCIDLPMQREKWYFWRLFDHALGQEKKKPLVSHTPVHKYVDSLLPHCPTRWAQCFVFSLSGKSGKKGQKKKEKWPKNTIKKIHINAHFLKIKKKKTFRIAFLPNVCETTFFFLIFLLFALYFSIFLFVGATSGHILQQCYSCPILPGYNASCDQEDRMADDQNHANISIRITQCSRQYICWTGRLFGYFTWYPHSIWH